MYAPVRAKLPRRASKTCRLSIVVDRPGAVIRLAGTAFAKLALKILRALDRRSISWPHPPKADIEALRHETEAAIEAVKVDLLKWLFGALIAQGGLIVALVNLLP